MQGSAASENTNPKCSAHTRKPLLFQGLQAVQELGYHLVPPCMEGIQAVSPNYPFRESWHIWELPEREDAAARRSIEPYAGSSQVWQCARSRQQSQLRTAERLHFLAPQQQAGVRCWCLCTGGWWCLRVGIRNAMRSEIATLHWKVRNGKMKKVKLNLYIRKSL